MKRYFILFLVFTTYVTATSLAQSSDQVDSARVYPLPAVTITGITSLPGMFRSPFSVNNISLNDSESIKTVSFSDIMSETGGTFIKDYGSLSGIKTISQRGMGSEHTLFLVNGMRVTSFENGLVDLGVIPLDDADQIIVTRGGQSAEYGSDAVGGSVDIISTPVHQSEPNTRISASLGSFGHQRYFLSMGIPLGNSLSIQAGYGEEHSTENYPFEFHNGNLTTEVTRQNANIGARFGHFTSLWTIDPLNSFTLYSSYYTSDRGSPGPFLGLGLTNQARETDDDGIFQIGYKRLLSTGTAFTVDAQTHYAYERYMDPGIVIGGIPLDDYFRNIDNRVDVKFTDSFSEGKYQYTAGIEGASTSGEGNSIGRSVLRSQGGLFLTGVSNIPIDDGVISTVSLFPAIRQDYIEPSTMAFSPQMGALLTFHDISYCSVKNVRTALRSHVSRNFRMPTFNELYYATGGGIGNPDLVPERSTSFDAGSDLSIQCVGKHTFSLTYYFIDMENRITWVGASGANVTPKNLHHVQSKGYEIAYHLSNDGDNVSVDANYTTTDAEKISADYPQDPTVNRQLVYIPVENANVSINTTIPLENKLLRSIGSTVQIQYVGYRFYSEDSSSFLPSNYITSADLHLRFVFNGLTGRLKFSIKNIFNEEYQLLLSYPMPLRSYQCNVEFQF